LASAKWIEGCNRMNLVIVPSKHSKDVFDVTSYTVTNKENGSTSELKMNVPCEILFEGIDKDLLHKKLPMENSIKSKLDSIPEDAVYLFVGHWMNGELGQDRKNTGMLVKSFFETFYNTEGDKPALLL